MDYRRYPVLLIDDDPSVRQAFQLAYGDEFSITTCDDPDLGLKRLKRTPNLAVVVADERMPGKNTGGVEFLGAARRVRPDVVRVLLTAYADLTLLDRAINQAEISRYVAKPWNHDELLEVLRYGIETAVRRRPVAGFPDAATLISQNVRRLRTEHGLNQVELGARAGVTDRTITHLEAADGNPTLSTLCAVAKVLRTDVVALLGRGDLPAAPLNGSPKAGRRPQTS